MLTCNNVSQYYISQPIDYNSPLGAGAYILASVEAERLGSQ